jgi:hypothetical protein
LIRRFRAELSPKNKTQPMKISRRPFHVLSLLALTGLTFAQGQSLPQSQPALLTIVREEIKPGRGADHAKHEAGWPAAYEKAKSPDFYLAMTSLTGPAEAWYLTPMRRTPPFLNR